MKNDEISKKQNETIFIRELIKLKEHGYINKEAFQYTMVAYNSYKHDEEKQFADSDTNIGIDVDVDTGVGQNKHDQQLIGNMYGMNKNRLDTNQYESNEGNLADNQFNSAKENLGGGQIRMNQIISNKHKRPGAFASSAPKYAPVQKKQLTPDQIREKNLNIILTLGTVFIFLAGLIFGTSSWSVIGDEVKTLLLLAVGTIFFGVSYVCKNILKIEKTSFTFWALGTMFLPLCLMSIGYFSLLGDYLSLQGSGKYIFCSMSALICIPIFYISFKKFSKQVYLYTMVLAIDFFIVCFINSFFYSLTSPSSISASASTSSYIYIVIITVLNGLVMFIHVKKDMIQGLNIPNLIKFNIVASFILLGFNFSNSYGFFIDTIVLSIILMYISILDKEVTPYRSISSGVLYSIGFCGISIKIVQDIFTKEYTLMVPLLLFLSLMVIHSLIKDILNVETSANSNNVNANANANRNGNGDKYFYHFTIASGILSFLLLCTLTPFFHQYQIVSMLGVLINFIGLILCYKIYSYLIYKNVIGILSFLFVGSMTVLANMNFEKQYSGLTFLVILSILILFWILMKDIVFIDVVYKPVFFSLNIWLVFSIGCHMIYNYEYTFLSFFCLILFSIYCYQNDFLRNLHKYSIAAEYYMLILSSLVFVNSRFPQFIFEQYMLVVFFVLCITQLVVGKKFKELGSLFKYLIFINWAFSLPRVSLLLLDPFNGYLITNQVRLYLIIFILLNICYFLYYYNKKKLVFLPTLAGLSFYPLLYLILMNNRFAYEAMMFIPVILIFALYFIYKNKVCLYNLYGFTAMCFLAGINSGLLLKGLCLVMVLILFGVSYKLDEFIATIVIGICAGFLSFLIPIVHIQDRTIHTFVIMVAAMVFRVVGLKLYKKLFVNEKMDILSSVSTILLIFTLELFPQSENTSYYQFLTYFVLAVSIYLESLRNKNLSKYLMLVSQLVLSIGYYTVAISLNPSSILLFKIYLIPVIAMYISLKLILKDKLDKNIYNLLNFVICFWLLVDVSVVDTVTNNILIGTILLGAMLAAMALNNKQIVNASIITLLTVLIIGYRRFLLSLPWWVYLLIIGSALIGVAIYLEKKRNRNKE